MTKNLPSPFAFLSRSACTECGSRKIEWMPVDQLAFRVDPEDRLRVFDMIGFTGQRADSWFCDRCANWGVFSQDWSF